MIKNYPLPTSPVVLPPFDGTMALASVLESGSAPNDQANSTIAQALTLQEYLSILGFFDVGIIAVNYTVDGPRTAPMLSLASITQPASASVNRRDQMSMTPDAQVPVPLSTLQTLPNRLYLQIWTPDASNNMDAGTWQDVAAVINMIFNDTGGLYQGTKRFLSQQMGVDFDLERSDVFRKAIEGVMIAAYHTAFDHHMSQVSQPLASSGGTPSTGGTVSLG